mmetsp:Transcript_48591/g.120490  ORF Transcript_48591/g.120490 Transcript_48591/m.120490 type:complete len:98 (-) Transcript_48591:171-464(-)
MRVIGLSWTDWKTPWSSSTDENVGTVGQLRKHLEEVLEEESNLRRRGELPSKEEASLSEGALAAECPGRRRGQQLRTHRQLRKVLALHQLMLSKHKR